MEVITENLDCQSSAPRGWEECFPEETYSVDDRRAQLIADLAEYFSKPATSWTDRIRNHHTHFSLHLDAEKLSECQSPDLQPALELQPLECLSCITISCLEVKKIIFGNAMLRKLLALIVLGCAGHVPKA
jgi:hypothetical protein